MDERTEEILNGFNESWLTTEKYFSHLIDDITGWDKLIPVYLFIQRLKKGGDNKLFRLGNSMQYLIISRSASPALRPEQQFIRIDARETSFVVSLRDATKMYREYTIKDLDDERLTGLLATLKSTLID
jgi:hypothetical protein